LSLANVERWERSVNDDEEELDRAKQAEQKQMSEIDLEMRKLDKMKSDRMAKKNDMDNMDEDIAKVIYSEIASFIPYFNYSYVYRLDVT
jgi:hypothetical protein